MARQMPPFHGDVDAYLVQSDEQLVRAVGARPARRTPRRGNFWGALAVASGTCLVVYGFLAYAVHVWGWH